MRPEKALLADTNKHIISVYRAIQDGTITPQVVRAFLMDEGSKLSRNGEQYYYEVRTRFNETHNPLDFLFLSRSCFNGVMRFNSYGRFNVPFCHKPERFSQAYITKIVNQVRTFSDVVCAKHWRFEVADFRETLALAVPGDFVYVDPPYAGRHVDYFNSWDANTETALIEALKNLPCRFLLSSWYGNKYRNNSAIQEHWEEEGFSIVPFEHFYHVGSSEDLRNCMTEVLVADYPISWDSQILHTETQRADQAIQQHLPLVSSNLPD